MRNRRQGVLVAMGLLLAAPAAQARLEKGQKAAVRFTAKGPAGMSIVGVTSDLLLRDDGQMVTVTVPLRNLTTGIALRDRHLREKYLQVDAYPNAELSVSRGALKAPVGSGTITGDAQGLMKIHGQARSVGFHYTAQRSGQIFQVQGSLRINLQDYGIKTPSFLGVTVKPDVEIAVSFEARESVVIGGKP